MVWNRPRVSESHGNTHTQKFTENPLCLGCVLPFARSRLLDKDEEEDYVNRPAAEKIAHEHK